jgi:DNA-binding transcriptional LysR family regulator
MSGITLDQLRVFVTIADLGSFAATARHLNRTQSSVTYTIQKLEEQTNLELFDRTAYRPTLTKAAHSLLPHARKVMADISNYRQHAKGIANGLEAAITITISQYAPNAPLMEVLAVLAQKFPTVRVSLSTVTIQTTEVLDNGASDLAILPEFIPFGSDYARAACGRVRMCAVARPDHPLAWFPGKIHIDAMHAHTQIITSARDAPTLQRNHAVQALNYWKVNDLETKLAMILRGIGWGGMPEHMVADHIRNGTLALLDPESWDGLDHMPILDIVVAHRQDRPLGPVAQWIFDQLKDAPR